MDLVSIIGGSHVLFFREGDAFTVPGPGVCAQEAKPGIGADVAHGLDPAWFDLGTLESADPTVSRTDHKLWKPNPGHLILKDVLETMQELSWKLVANEFGNFTFEAGFQSSAKLGGATTTGVPLSSVSKRGWMNIQTYDHNDTLLFRIWHWCRVRPKFKFDATPVKPEWEVFMLYSSLNGFEEFVGPGGA